MTLTDLANHHDTSEYAVFTWAYSAYYGISDDTNVERAFSRYMREQMQDSDDVPVFVRHFMRTHHEAVLEA